MIALPRSETISVASGESVGTIIVSAIYSSTGTALGFLPRFPCNSVCTHGGMISITCTEWYLS
jgi:hypothetical protein